MALYARGQEDLERKSDFPKVTQHTENPAETTQDSYTTWEPHAK
jgi:hypothetical protein